MNLQYEVINDCPIVIVDDFLSEEGLTECWATIDSFSIPGLLPPEDTASATVEGELIKRNKALFLNEIYESAPMSCRMAHPLFERYAEFREKAWNVHPAFRTLRNPQVSMLLSYYGNGDYYQDHVDACPITALYWLCKDRSKFEGGDLTIEGQKTYEFRNNRMILFPGYTYHQVSPITMDQDDELKGLGRWTVTLFNGFNLEETHAFV